MCVCSALMVGGDGIHFLKYSRIVFLIAHKPICVMRLRPACAIYIYSCIPYIFVKSSRVYGAQKYIEMFIYIYTCTVHILHI